MRAVMVAGVMVAACTDQGGPGFTYQATAWWTAMEPPSVVGLTIDGAAVGSNTQYMFAETFASYDDALAEFVAKPVVVETTSGAVEFTLDIGVCQRISPDQLPTPLVLESDHFVVMGELGDDAPVFEIDEYSCMSADMAIDVVD